MKKSNIRTMVTHWDTVWFHYRANKNLLPKDKIVTKFVRPGKTLAWDSLGFRYKSHIADLTVYEQLLDICPDLNDKFTNILVLNSFNLRYNSIEEYAHILGNLCNHLELNGRLVFGVNSIFINWNRTAVSVEQLFEQFASIMLIEYSMHLKHQVLTPFTTAALNGDCFLIFDKQT
jgi:hypothetical protein